MKPLYYLHTGDHWFIPTVNFTFNIYYKQELYTCHGRPLSCIIKRIHKAFADMVFLQTTFTYDLTQYLLTDSFSFQSIDIKVTNQSFPKIGNSYKPLLGNDKEVILGIPCRNVGRPFWVIHIKRVEFIPISAMCQKIVAMSPINPYGAQWINFHQLFSACASRKVDN